jgi:hypothetical protein
MKGSMDMEYIIGADDMGNLRTWVDASYAVHPDMRSHTGGVMSFGTGGVLCKSTEQKPNTKSSTETEVVGASDYLPNTIWTKMFLHFLIINGKMDAAGWLSYSSIETFSFLFSSSIRAASQNPSKGLPGLALPPL